MWAHMAPSEIFLLVTRKHRCPRGSDGPVKPAAQSRAQEMAALNAVHSARACAREGGRDGGGHEARPRGWAAGLGRTLCPLFREQPSPRLVSQSGCRGDPDVRYWVKCQRVLPKPGVRGRHDRPGSQGTEQNRGFSRQEHGASAHARGRPVGPRRFTVSLARPFPALMKSHKKERREPGLLFGGTVYPINCIFMIKFTTLREQGAKDMGWVCMEKLTADF